MNIRYQNNNNDCGVCVLSSIYEYLYKRKINDETILNKFKIGKNGISIYDLEILAKEINIDLETYNADFKQLMNLNYKDYFITLFKSELGNHFVICKIKKTFIEIHDSIKGLIKISFEEFEKIYNNIFIVFSKSNFKKEINFGDEIINKTKFFDFSNEFLFCFLIIFLDLVLLVISLIGSSLVKFALGLVENNTSQNLFFIGLYFLIIFLLESLIIFLISLIKIKKIDELTKRNIIFYINYLNNKNFLFFCESNKKKLYQYPQAISKLLSFKYIEKPQLIADIIFLISLTFMLCYISFYYMLFGILYSFISICLSYFLKKFNEKNYENNNLLKNQTDFYFQMLYDFLYKEKNLIKCNYLMNQCKSYFWSLSKQNIDYSSYLLKNNFLKTFFKKIIFLFFVVISLFWINNNSNQNIDIGKMIFAVTILNMFDNTTNSTFNFVSEFANYKKSKKLLDDFLIKENKKINETKKINIKKIKSIKISNLSFQYDNDNKIFDNFNFELENNTLINGKNGIGKSTFLKILSLNLPIDKNSKLFFNDLNYTDINLKDLENRICYVPSDATPVEVDYSAILHNNPGLIKSLSLFLKETKLSSKSINEFSKGETQLSNLINLLNLKNNLILLDECFSNISLTNIELFMNLFYGLISESNFVICVSHSNVIKKYFKHFKEIK